MNSVFKLLYSIYYTTYTICNPDVSTQHRDFRALVKAAFSLPFITGALKQTFRSPPHCSSFQRGRAGECGRFQKGNRNARRLEHVPPQTSRCAGEDKAQPPPLT